MPGCATHDYGLQGEWEECGLCCAKPHQSCMWEASLIVQTDSAHQRESWLPGPAFSRYGIKLEHLLGLLEECPLPCSCAVNDKQNTHCTLLEMSAASLPQAAALALVKMQHMRCGQWEQQGRLAATGFLWALMLCSHTFCWCLFSAHCCFFVCFFFNTGLILFVSKHYSADSAAPAY